LRPDRLQQRARAGLRQERMEHREYRVQLLKNQPDLPYHAPPPGGLRAGVVEHRLDEAGKMLRWTEAGSFFHAAYISTAFPGFKS
jgi:hypothetical protein